MQRAVRDVRDVKRGSGRNFSHSIHSIETQSIARDMDNGSGKDEARGAEVD